MKDSLRSLRNVCALRYANRRFGETNSSPVTERPVVTYT